MAWPRTNWAAIAAAARAEQERKKAEEEERKRQAAAALAARLRASWLGEAARKKAAEEERQRQAAAAAANARRLAQIAIEAARKAEAERKRREEEARKAEAERKRQEKAAAEKAKAEAEARAAAEARLAAKNEAIAYSQNQTNALRSTIMATIAMEAAAAKKAQEASDVATRLKFERIAEESRNLALKRNAERKELLEQIKKNKLEADRLQKETRNEFVGEVGKITKWQDEHTKMPVNFVVNFLPTNV